VCVAFFLSFFFSFLFLFFFSFSSLSLALLAAIGRPHSLSPLSLLSLFSPLFLFFFSLFPAPPSFLPAAPTSSPLFLTCTPRTAAARKKQNQQKPPNPTRLHSALRTPRATGRCHAVPKLFTRHRTSPHCTAPHCISFHRPARPLPLLSVFFRPSAWPLLLLRRRRRLGRVLLPNATPLFVPQDFISTHDCS